MSRQFLELKDKEQLEILQYYAAEANKDMSILEKDIWIFLKILILHWM